MNQKTAKKDPEPGTVLRFERRLAHPPEKVWRALTEDEELAKWLPAARAPGERKVVESSPPRLLEYTSGEETLRWEITPEVGGCLLVLTTTIGKIHARASASNDVTRMAA